MNLVPPTDTSSLLTLIRQRRSVRRYADRPVEREKILQCIEAARLAPSAQNVQPWRFVVLDDPAIKDRFCARVCSGIYRPIRFVQQAPALIVLLAKIDLLAHRIGRRLQGTPYYLIDIGIAGEHLVLQATELGIGTCWIGWFNARAAQEALDLPRTYKVVALIAVGYPAKDHAVRGRKRTSIEELVSFNGFHLT